MLEADERLLVGLDAAPMPDLSLPHEGPKPIEDLAALEHSGGTRATASGRAPRRRAAVATLRCVHGRTTRSFAVPPGSGSGRAGGDVDSVGSIRENCR